MTNSTSNVHLDGNGGDLAGGVRPQPVHHLGPGDGRRFPNGVCGCTSPTSSTTSGGTMSVAYVAAYSTGGGSSAPTPTPTPTTSSGGGGGSGSSAGPITGYNGLCVDVRRASAADFTPIQVYTYNGTNAQQWKLS